MNDRKAAVLNGHTDERRRAVAEMLLRLAAGERVVVGTHEEVKPGRVMGRSGGIALVVKRRATREEFLANAPLGADLSTAPTAPFYWELEVGD